MKNFIFVLALGCAILLMNNQVSANPNPPVAKAKKESIFKKIFKKKSSKHCSMEQRENIEIIHRYHLKRLLTRSPEATFSFIS